MKHRGIHIHRNYALTVPYPPALGQCRATYLTGLRCTAHRRLRGSESIFCSEHAKLPLLEADAAYMPPPPRLPTYVDYDD